MFCARYLNAPSITYPLYFILSTLKINWEKGVKNARFSQNMAKNHEIRFRVSEEELHKLEYKAREIGLPVSSFCRLMSLSAKISTEYTTK